MPRPVDPSKIIAFTTMKNFRPRPNAVMAANLLAEEDRDPSCYEKNPWQPLARAIGIQRYDTALMIMRTAAVLPDEVKEQYDRLAGIHQDMEDLYRIWYQDGGLFSAKNTLLGRFNAIIAVPPSPVKGFAQGHVEKCRRKQRNLALF